MPIKKPQALKNYCNKYFNLGNYRNTCINRRGYWQMLAVVLPCRILVDNMADYLVRNFASPHNYDFQALISSPYFTLFLFLLLFYAVILALFIIIASHRCRDIGISRWYILLLLVPYIKTAFIFILGSLEKDAVKKYRLAKTKKQTDKTHRLVYNGSTDEQLGSPRIMPIKKLQALKDYYNKYFSQANYRTACINRRGYWQMLAIVAPCHVLVLYGADYLDLTFSLPYISDLKPLIFSPYFIPWCLLLFFHIVLFFTIASHRCRDIGISRWYTLLVLVPYIKTAFIFILGSLEKDAVKKYRKKHSLGKNKKTDR